MAHTKAGGSTQLGRDSRSKRLGIKKFGNQKVQPGNIIVRQRGTKFRPGDGTTMGNDNTIMATKEGFVQFTTSKAKRFTGRLKQIRTVHVIDEPVS